MQNRFGTKEFNLDQWIKKFKKVNHSQKEKMSKEFLSDAARCLGTDKLTSLADEVLSEKDK
jgi:hypothetical protein